jgi:chemotaxis protein MotA
VTTPIGIILALLAIFGSMIMEGGNPAALIAPSSLVLVFLGTFGAAIAGITMGDAKNIVPVMLVALKGKTPDPAGSIELLVGFAETARRDGLLALESSTNALSDPFLQKGIQLAIDGTDPEQLEGILGRDVDAMKARHKANAKVFADMGGYAPTMGIIGTVLGLIHVLGSLSDPNSLGPLIAAAFTATLWGVLTANVIWIPVANKLKRSSAVEAQNREIIMDGILAIQAGNSPRLLEQQLSAQLAPKERPVIKKKAA